jgi:hypothetical protein
MAPFEGTLDERGRRLWAGAEADALGHGGVAMRRARQAWQSARLGRALEKLVDPVTRGDPESRSPFLFKIEL